MRFILRHILRARARSLLIVLVAMFFILALAWLSETIRRSEDEIDRLYDTTLVAGTIQSVPALYFGPMRFLGNTIRYSTVQEVRETGLVQNLYIEAGHDWAAIIPADTDGNLPENWNDIVEIDLERETRWLTELADPLFATNDIDAFRRNNSLRYFDDLPGVVRMFHDHTFVQNLYYEFSADFCAQAFEAFEFSPDSGERIPMILSTDLAEFRGLEIGDNAYIGATIGATQIWHHYPAVVVGTHNRNILTNRLRDCAIIPLAAMKHITGENMGYIILDFNIDPAYNREILAVHDELYEIVTRRDAAFGFVRLGVILRDEELRTMVATVDQTLGLLYLLYPVAVVTSVAVAIALSALLMLQNAKNAAIKRVLGITKIKTRVVFLAEIMALTLAGLAIGVGAVVVLNRDIALFQTLYQSALYFFGAFSGAAVASVLITNRPPLDLLQVRE